jgi:hypothetical protein
MKNLYKQGLNNNKKKTMVSTEFAKILTDFVQDIQRTFPEFSLVVVKWWKNGNNLEYLYDYCVNFYKNKFFDILNRNDSIFEDGICSEFLPGISFSYLWKYDDISEQNKDMIWNYLQMIVICLVDELKANTTTETASGLFDCLQSDEFNKKLRETIGELQKNLIKEVDEQEEEEEKKIPSFESTFLDSKLAGLAKEIAEETTQDFQEGFENIKDVNGIFEHMLKDPSKLMNMVKNVGAKLDTKLKSGELKESEIMNEATVLMDRMKSIPGMNNIHELMKNMHKTPTGTNTGANTVTSTKKKKATQQTQEQYLNELYNQMLKQQEQTAQLMKH